MRPYGFSGSPLAFCTKPGACSFPSLKVDVGRHLHAVDPTRPVVRTSSTVPVRYCRLRLSSHEADEEGCARATLPRGLTATRVHTLINNLILCIYRNLRVEPVFLPFTNPGRTLSRFLRQALQTRVRVCRRLSNLSLEVLLPVSCHRDFIGHLDPSDFPIVTERL